MEVAKILVRNEEGTGRVGRGTKGSYQRPRGLRNDVDDSRRREAEWKTDGGEGRFIMACCGSRAAEMTMEENCRGRNRSSICVINVKCKRLR